MLYLFVFIDQWNFMLLNSRTALIGPLHFFSTLHWLGKWQNHKLYLRIFTWYLSGFFNYFQHPGHLTLVGVVVNVRAIVTHIQHLVWLELSISEVRWNVLHHESLISETVQWQPKVFLPHIYIWMLRKDKKVWRRTDVLEVWNGLTSKPPGKNLKHEMQAPDWQELFRERSKPGSAFQAASLPELWEAYVAGRDSGRGKTLSELRGM